jgi:hypothetical protein
MNDYPLKVYLSASWRGDNAVIDKLVATHLMRQGVTVLQDHPDNKTDPPIKPWLRRVDLYMRDCGGLVAVLPFRPKDPQTTSPYMFPEILSAARHGLSILIFHHQGVRISRSDTAGAAEISFGVEDRELLNADSSLVSRFEMMTKLMSYSRVHLVSCCQRTPSSTYNRYLLHRKS